MKIDRRLLRKSPCDPKAHPLVRFIDEETERRGVSLAALSERAGVDRDLLTSWRKNAHGNPHILSLEAVLGALGYELKPVRKGADA